jgi:hypothetical protein
MWVNDILETMFQSEAGCTTASTVCRALHAPHPTVPGTLLQEKWLCPPKGGTTTARHSAFYFT